MRQFLFYLLLLTSYSLSAQLVIDPLPVPVPGDTIERFIATSDSDVDPGMSGQDQIWNWTLEDSIPLNVLVEANMQDTIFANANFRLLLPGGISQYFIIDESSWTLLGFTGVDPVGFDIHVLSKYTTPLDELSAPLAFGDMFQEDTRLETIVPIEEIPDSLLAMFPVVPDSLRVAIIVDRQEEVDGSGVLTIDGMSYDVLRQHRTDYREVRIEAKISIFPWQDVTGTVLMFAPFEIPTNDTLNSYRFLAQDAGPPIAEVFTNPDDGSVTRVEYAREEIAAGSRDISLVEAIVFPNPSAGQFMVQVDHAIETDPQIVLYDLLGRKVPAMVIRRTENRWDVQMTGQPNGLYLVRVEDLRGNRLAEDHLISLISGR